MGDAVPKERQVLLAPCLSHLGIGYGEGRGSPLVGRGISDQLRENVLVDELLDDSLSGVHLNPVLRLVTASIGLLAVIAASLRRLTRVTQYQALKEVDRGVHRSVIGNIFQSHIHKINLAHLVGKATLIVIPFQDIN